MCKKASMTVARGIPFLVCAVMILAIAGGLTVSASSVPIEHPMTVINKADLAIVKDRIANSIQPQKAAYDYLISEANKALSFTPVPPIHLQVSDGDNLNSARSLMTDNGGATYTLALAWLYSTDRDKAVEYADKAISIMRAWSDKSTYFYGGNPGLHTGSSFIGMIYAADILHEYSGWSQADRKAFEDFWRTRLLPLHLQVVRGPMHYNNWGDAASNAAMAAAIAFEDIDLRDEIIRFQWGRFYPINTPPYNTVVPNEPHPKYKTYNLNDVQYPVLAGEVFRKTGTEYMGVNYHAFAFTSHSQVLEAVRYTGLNLWEKVNYDGTTIDKIVEQYFKWNFQDAFIPLTFMSSDLTSVRRQSSENTLEIAVNNYPNLLPDIKVWLETDNHRPAGNKGDNHSTLNKGDMPVAGNQVAVPSYSPHGGKFFGTRSVTITSFTDQAEIYYTLDGSEPTTSSVRYEGPIAVNGTATLKARAFKTGMTPSLLASEDYVKEALPDPLLVMGQLEADSTAERTGNNVDAFKFTAPSDFVVTRLNVRFADSSQSGGGIRMALYSNNDGKPGTLLGETGSFLAGPGMRSAPLKVPYQIEGGKDYWIATWMAASPLATAIAPAGLEKATFIASNTGERYTASSRYFTNSTSQDNLTPFMNFPAGTAFTASGTVTYAVYATAETEPGFYVDTQLSISRKAAVAGLSFLNTMPEGDDRSVWAVFGRYSEDGKLLDVILKSYTVVAGANASGDTLTMPLEGGEYAKLMLWDRISNLRPLLPAKRVDSLKSDQIYTVQEDGGFKVLGAIAADTFTSVAVTDEDNEIVYINQTKSDTEGNFEFFVPMTTPGEYYVSIGTPNPGPVMLTDITLSESGAEE